MENQYSGKFQTLQRVAPFFKDHRRIIFFAAVAIIFSTLLGSALPLILREIIDKGLPAKEINRIMLLALTYLLILMGQQSFEYLQSILVGNMGIDIVNNIKAILLKHTLNLPISFFTKHESGKLISRVEADSQQLFTLFSSVSLSILEAALQLGASLIIMYIANPQFTLIILAICPIYMAIVYLFFAKMRPPPPPICLPRLTLCPANNRLAHRWILTSIFALKMFPFIMIPTNPCEGSGHRPRGRSLYSKV